MEHPFGCARCRSTCLPKALLLSHHCCCFTCQRIALLAQRFCAVLHPPPRSGVSPARNTRVTTVVSSVVGWCAPQPGLSPGWRVFCYPRPRTQSGRIRPYALPGSDSPAGTARQSIELEESATLWDLLQPGRVAWRWRPFLASTATRPEPVPGEDVALRRGPFLAHAATRPDAVPASANSSHSRSAATRPEPVPGEDVAL